MGPGPPPRPGLASSNLATLLGIKPPELEAQEAGRVDESLFLQREARRRSRPPRPDPSPHGLPGPLLPTPQDHPPFPGPLRPPSQTYFAQLALSCLNLQLLERLRIPGRERLHKLRSKRRVRNGIREGSLADSEAPAASSGHTHPAPSIFKSDPIQEQPKRSEARQVTSLDPTQDTTTREQTLSKKSTPPPSWISNHNSPQQSRYQLDYSPAPS